MNALKFQQEALKAYVLKPGDKRTVCWCTADEDRVALILDSCVGVFVPNAEMVLDRKVIPSIEGWDGLRKARGAWVESNLLTPTEEYRFQSGNKKVRIYQARAWQTGIDQSLLKYFDLANIRLYQQKEHDIIFITEKGKGGEAPVGIVMPVRI